MVVTCNDEEIGRLYAGDFMWLPASFSNAADDIEVREKIIQILKKLNFVQ